MTVTVHVPAEKKDIESAYDKVRRPWECKCIANFLLVIGVLIVVGLGAGAFSRLIFGNFGKHDQVATITNLTQVEKVIVILGLPVAPGVGMSPFGPSGTANSSIVNPKDLLNWPKIFQQEGGMDVYVGPAIGQPRCEFMQMLNVTQGCLRECYRVLDSNSSATRVWTDGKYCYDIEDGVDGDGIRIYPVEDHGLVSGPLRNFTEWPNVKLFPRKMSRPTVTIKMPLLDMSYSDHTKMCLSFCAINPSCVACSAFPDEPMLVDQLFDKVVGPTGSNGTLSCLLFSYRENTDLALHMVQKFDGTVSFTSVGPNASVTG